ncbi:MAG: HAD family hydrolase [Candidatus Omnitrophota bacterium]
MIKNIKLVIFDLDGTLVDAYRAIIKSFNFTMQKLGYSAQDSLTIRRAVGWGDSNLLEPFVKSKDLKKALILYRRHHKTALVKYSRLLPGAEKVLHCLKGKGYKLAVASNRPTQFSWILIRSLGLRGYFDYVLCADKLKCGKPCPGILNKITRRLIIKPTQAVYVGDMAIDAQAGRRAGITTVIVTTGSSTVMEARKEKPYRIISRIAELLNML